MKIKVLKAPFPMMPDKKEGEEVEIVMMAPDILEIFRTFEKKGIIKIIGDPEAAVLQWRQFP